MGAPHLSASARNHPGHDTILREDSGIREDAGVGVAATQGVHGSASTWVFNVLRELTIAAHGADSVFATFYDSAARVIADPRARGRHIVLKLHWGDDGWPVFAALTRARVILTIRDPRDAVLSMMQRFGTGMDVACATVLRGFRAVAENTEAGHPRLRYEDRFFDYPATVGALAGYLGLTVDAGEQRRIFQSYTTDSVRRFGLALDTLPTERIKRIGDATRYDDVTHIHRTHIGDQRIGKWRDQFDAEQRKLLTARFAPFLRAFGYDNAL